jgi:hypothetical protein
MVFLSRISEAAEPCCVTFSAIKLANTPRWSEAASLEVAKIFRPIWDGNPLQENCELCRKQVRIKTKHVTFMDSWALVQ